MKVSATRIPDVLLFEPKIFGDDRGFFFESYNKRAFAEATGLDVEFVQDNHSRSKKNVLRGLHYQIGRPQGKLVRVVAGKVFDVAVDLRRSSPNFGRWVGFYLSADAKNMAWIPAGFAHGFLVISETADFVYKTTDFYAPQEERTVRWDDPDVAIEWPLDATPILTDKDRAGASLKSAEVFP